MKPLLRAALAALSATQGLCSCAYGTSIQPRFEAEVEVDGFGYVGLNVRQDPFLWQ